jgi:hypothetical protein
MQLPEEHRVHRRTLWDLSQSDERPSMSVTDGSLPTFTKNTALWHRDLGRFLSPRQQLRIMGWPMTPADREAAALPASWPTWPTVEAAAELRPIDVRRLAGDALNFHCIAVVIAAVCIFAERR